MRSTTNKRMALMKTVRDGLYWHAVDEGPASGPGAFGGGLPQEAPHSRRAAPIDSREDSRRADETRLLVSNFVHVISPR